MNKILFLLLILIILIIIFIFTNKITKCKDRFNKLNIEMNGFNSNSSIKKNNLRKERLREFEDLEFKFNKTKNKDYEKNPKKCNNYNSPNNIDIILRRPNINNLKENFGDICLPSDTSIIEIPCSDKRLSTKQPIPICRPCSENIEDNLENGNDIELNNEHTDDCSSEINDKYVRDFDPIIFKKKKYKNKKVYPKMKYNLKRNPNLFKGTDYIYQNKDLNKII